MSAAFGKRSEYQQEIVVPPVRYHSPHRSERNVFCVDKPRAGTGILVNQEGGFPYPDQHVLVVVIDITMYVDKGVFQAFRFNGSQYINVDKWLNLYRRLNKRGTL